MANTQTHFNARHGAWLAILGCALLGACSGGSSKGSDPATKDASASAKAVTASADANLVAAVASGKPGAAVDLKFDLAKRPRVGEPLEVTVVVTARAADIDSLQVIFQSTDGIQVTGGAALPPQEKPTDGQSFTHTVTIVPQRDGVFYLSAVALIESGGDGASSLARTFAIPVIVGDGVAAAAALSKAAEDSVTSGPGGERVIPMPAEQSTTR